MDATEVVIVGAGPSGLALAISLSKLKVKSIVLEKVLEIPQDPRGVAMTHDALRICWDLGLGNDMERIGHATPSFNFHKTSWKNAPFFSVDSSTDAVGQGLPTAIFHIQPVLELVMREQLNASQYCQLRCGCTVTDQKQSGSDIIVEYVDAKGKHKNIRSSWLIGADGKRGVVRKQFLERTAGVRQVDSAYKYDGTWVAANLEISLPTPESHPRFPLWKSGYTPDAVYDLFWPIGWHFGSPPGKPLAAGRFGPHEARLWRHEFAQNDWDDNMDAEELLWEHLAPMITRESDLEAKKFPSGEVTYPRDCIKILRCRPFRFTHKIVNKWFDGRIILIGDAAHVFPPFGGQGIASGLRDAQQLAWRLALLQRLPKLDRSICDGILEAWAQERTYSIGLAADVTSINGQLCNYGDSWGFWLQRNLAWIMEKIPFLPSPPDPFATTEARGFTTVDGGFFASAYAGGGRLPQVYLSSQQTGPTLSDFVLEPKGSVMSLIVIAEDDPASDVVQARQVLDATKIHEALLSHDSIKVLSSKPFVGGIEVFYPTTLDRFPQESIPIRPLYKPSTIFSRFSPNTRFIILRPDFFIFGLANNSSELAGCITDLRGRFQSEAS
ncbi:hypothetical protein F4808DRAFT_467697 [Astrocystis sublimbata]|nr:hypothetical protein F4808DRAFT_467697 [Astrocystis sublimbata]